MATGLRILVLTWSILLLSVAALSAQNTVSCRPTYPPSFDQTTITDYAQTREVITVSVIFHVVWKEAEENISDAQILSQLEVLNADFRALNDQSNVPVGFQDDVADAEIEFCLAQRLPDNSPTDGILRTQTDESLIGLKEVLYTASPAVDSDRYLNIWVADLGGGLNGTATFPGSVSPDKDGIVIDPDFVGTVGTATESQPYHLGRTLTHEVGHYLNLYHVFGTTTSGSCGSDDFVEDTPNSENTYLGECPSGIEFSCGSSDMWMNFMYFTDDACMSMFTTGQKARMHATLNETRAGLQSSTGCMPVATDDLLPHATYAVYPNPATEYLIAERINGQLADTAVRIYDGTGNLIYRIRTRQSVIRLPLAAAANGVYFLVIEDENGLQTRRFLIL